MARPPRINFRDALYHVTARGNGRARIFFTDADRSRFLDQLQDNVATAAVLLYAFVLMENHFHLRVRTPRANLSQFMQLLESYCGSSYPGYVDAKRALEFVCYDVLKLYSRCTVARRRRQAGSTERLQARVPSGRRWSDFGSLQGQPVCRR